VPAGRFVDFHCHLDLFPDHAELFKACDRDEIFTLAVTTTPRAWEQNQRLASQTKFVRAALGLHPQLVQERASELDIWRQLLPGARYVGEVGLDAGPRFYASFEQQKDVFKAILTECAQQRSKILTVHSVRAAKVVLDMIETFLPRSRGGVVLHWFTGSKAEAERAVRLGCYFSINRAMLHHDRHRATVQALPIDRLLTETDGPFAQIDGRKARPQDVATTIQELSQSLSIQSDELAGVIVKNLGDLVAD
jgi:TatD DNase family protein